MRNVIIGASLIAFSTLTTVQASGLAQQEKPSFVYSHYAKTQYPILLEMAPIFGQHAFQP